MMRKCVASSGWFVFWIFSSSLSVSAQVLEKEAFLNICQYPYHTITNETYPTPRLLKQFFSDNFYLYILQFSESGDHLSIMKCRSLWEYLKNEPIIRGYEHFLKNITTHMKDAKNLYEKKILNDIANLRVINEDLNDIEKFHSSNLSKIISKYRNDCRELRMSLTNTQPDEITKSRMLLTKIVEKFNVNNQAKEPLETYLNYWKRLPKRDKDDSNYASLISLHEKRAKVLLDIIHYSPNLGNFNSNDLKIALNQSRSTELEMAEQWRLHHQAETILNEIPANPTLDDLISARTHLNGVVALVARLHGKIQEPTRALLDVPDHNMGALEGYLNSGSQQPYRSAVRTALQPIYLERMSQLLNEGGYVDALVRLDENYSRYIGAPSSYNRCANALKKYFHYQNDGDRITHYETLNDCKELDKRAWQIDRLSDIRKRYQEELRDQLRVILYPKNNQQLNQNHINKAESIVKTRKKFGFKEIEKKRFEALNAYYDAMKLDSPDLSEKIENIWKFPDLAKAYAVPSLEAYNNSETGAFESSIISITLYNTTFLKEEEINLYKLYMDVIHAASEKEAIQIVVERQTLFGIPKEQKKRRAFDILKKIKDDIFTWPIINRYLSLYFVSTILDKTDNATFASQTLSFLIKQMKASNRSILPLPPRVTGNNVSLQSIEVRLSDLRKYVLLRETWLSTSMRLADAYKRSFEKIEIIFPTPFPETVNEVLNDFTQIYHIENFSLERRIRIHLMIGDLNKDNSLTVGASHHYLTALELGRNLPKNFIIYENSKDKKKFTKNDLETKTLDTIASVQKSLQSQYSSDVLSAVEELNIFNRSNLIFRLNGNRSNSEFGIKNTQNDSLSNLSNNETIFEFLENFFNFLKNGNKEYIDDRFILFLEKERNSLKWLGRELAELKEEDAIPKEITGDIIRTLMMVYNKRSDSEIFNSLNKIHDGKISALIENWLKEE